jgi:hypothetical protein
MRSISTSYARSIERTTKVTIDIVNKGWTRSHFESSEAGSQLLAF